MKLSTSFDQTVKENWFLRSIVKLLLFTNTILAALLLLLYDKPPLMVEHTAHGMEIVRSTELKNSEDDVKASIALQIKARFDTDVKSPEVFLAPKQLLLRDTEQKDLKAHGMSQTVLVRKVTINKNEARVDFDRLISVGDVRSAMKAQVKVSFEEVDPNELNPYGLILSVAEPLQLKDEEKK